jgi:pyruvate formate lyase activating enzyme
MLIGGLLKFSLINYPGKIACAIFTQGCPFRCGFCHNPELVLKEKFLPRITEEEVFSFLEKKKDQLDGVVISGGEPTIQKDLIDFIKKIKKLNYFVKLDTNGIHPKIIQSLLDDNLLDYIAMDIKAPFEKYNRVIGISTNIENIKKSIDIIINSDIDHEFRSTIISDVHTENDIISMAKQIKCAKLFVLQKFRAEKTLCDTYRLKKPISDKTLQSLKKVLQQYVKTCQFR